MDSIWSKPPGEIREKLNRIVKDSTILQLQSGVSFYVTEKLNIILLS